MADWVIAIATAVGVLTSLGAMVLVWYVRSAVLGQSVHQTGSSLQAMEEENRRRDASIRRLELEYVTRSELKEKLDGLEEKIKLHIESLRSESRHTRDLIVQQNARITEMLKGIHSMNQFVLLNKRPELPPVQAVWLDEKLPETGEGGA